MFNASKRREVGAQLFNLGERRALSEDKVAVSSTGKYDDNDKQGWVKTTGNYLVSKAFEMAMFIPWAESAQAHTIGHAHVHALHDCGFMCATEPIQLSRDLWGYLNLALTGKQKLAFNNVHQGNGFEAWRRLVVPIVLRSDARLHDMQGDINVPGK